MGFPAKAESIGCGRLAEGVVIVNGRLLEVPAELDTVTFAGLEAAVSDARIVAVSEVGGVPTVVARGDPFQFNIESLVKVVPGLAFTMRAKFAELPQYGAEDCASDAIEGGFPCTAPIEK